VARPSLEVDYEKALDVLFFCQFWVRHIGLRRARRSVREALLMIGNAECSLGDYMAEDAKTVRILYTNYRGETSLRTIVPEKIWFGSTEWHPESQWLLDALDLEKSQGRSFAMKDIRAWVETH